MVGYSFRTLDAEMGHRGTENHDVSPTKATRHKTLPISFPLYSVQFPAGLPLPLNFSFRILCIRYGSSYILFHVISLLQYPIDHYPPRLLISRISQLRYLTNSCFLVPCDPPRAVPVIRERLILATPTIQSADKRLFLTRARTLYLSFPNVYSLTLSNIICRVLQTVYVVRIAIPNFNVGP